MIRLVLVAAVTAAVAIGTVIATLRVVTDTAPDW